MSKADLSWSFLYVACWGQREGKIDTQTQYILPLDIIQGVLAPESCQAFRAKMLEIPEPK